MLVLKGNGGGEGVVEFTLSILSNSRHLGKGKTRPNLSSPASTGMKVSGRSTLCKRRHAKPQVAPQS